MSQLFNGSHRSAHQGYFEWWYFHIVDTSEVTVNLVLHETDIFGFRKNPYVSMSVWDKKKGNCHVRRDLPNGFITRSATHLQAGSLFVENLLETRIDVEFPGGNKISGVLVKRTPPVALNEGVLFEDNLGRRSNWVIQVPLGYFKGMMTIEGREQRLEGVAYQDHQWGSLPLVDFVSSWAWGSFATEDFSTLFYLIQLLDGSHVQRFVQINHGKIYTSAIVGPAFDVEKLVATAKSEKYDLMSVVRFPGGQMLTYRTSADGVMRSRISENHDTFEASYVRWASRAQFENMPHKFGGVTECLHIRRLG